MQNDKIAELQGSVFAVLGLRFFEVIDFIHWDNVATGVVTGIFSAVCGYYVIKIVKSLERRFKNGI